ncbi:MAG: hypothetical protein L3J54_02955 [Draconibacterium sp.]|nr:hypothetical protein [Draconibacterium sp.]
MSKTASEFYTEKLEKYTSELKTVSQKLRQFTWYRFIAFILIFTPLFIFGTKSWATLIISVSAIIIFFFLIKKNVQLDKKKRKYIELKKIVEDELLTLKHSFSHFNNGKEFLDTDHFFSYDLDLFGEGSLFQFLNRTSTVNGKQQLASWLIRPSTKKEEIEKRQQAIKELAIIPNWRLHFLANGGLFKETEEMNHEIKAWSELKLPLNRATGIKWLIRLLPVATLLSVIPSVLGISDLYLVITVLSQWLLMYFFWRKITQYFGFFGRKSELLAKYIQLLKFVEEREFQAEYLNAGFEGQKAEGYYLLSAIYYKKNQLVLSYEYYKDLIDKTADKPFCRIGYNYLIKDYKIKLSFDNYFQINQGNIEKYFASIQLQIFLK